MNPSDDDKVSIELEEKAARFEQQVEDLFIDPDGLSYSVIHKRHLRPYIAADFSATDSYRRIWEEQGWPTIEAFTNYENTPAHTGLYLAYQTYRYQATGESVCLDRAGRTLDAIKRNFDIGESALERGYWPKPFGGLGQAHRSKDMTPDNNFDLIFGLNKYLDVASSTQYDLAADILKGIIDFYVRHEFDHRWLLESGYRGLFDYINTYHHHVGPIMICCMKIAAERFGADPYQHLYEELLDTHNDVFNSLFETHVQKQQRLGDAYWSHPDMAAYHSYPDHLLENRELGIVTIGGAWSSVGESLGYLAHHDPERADFFRSAAQHWLLEDIEPSYAGNGWGYTRMAYDYRERRILRTPPEIIRETVQDRTPRPHKGMHNSPDASLSGGIWTLASMGLALANPDIGADRFTRRLLRDLDEQSLCTFNESEKEQWSPERQHITTQYLGPLFWLHTYYCGRVHRFW